MKLFWGKLRSWVLKYDIWLILLLATALRVAKLRYAFYGTIGELYRDLSVVYDFLVFHKWPLLGPSASLGGFYFGAIYYYLMAPFVWLFRFGPQGGTFTSTFFSLLGIWMIYQLIKLWWDRRDMAILGALLAAVSLFDVQNAYYISNPTLMPFFLLLFFYSLTKMLQQGSTWWNTIGLAVAFGIVTQLHATALLLIPVILVFTLAVKRPKIPWYHIAAFIVIVVGFYMPYIVFESQNHFANSKGILHLGEANYSFFVQAQALGSIIAFWDKLFLFKNDFFNLLYLNRWLYIMFLGFYFVVPVWLFLWLRKKPILQKAPAPSPSGKFLFWTWLVLGSLMFAFFQHEVRYFYYLVLWPVPVLALTWFLFWLKDNNRRFFHYVLWTFLVFQIVQLGYFYRVADNKAFDHKKLLSMFDHIATDARGQSFNIINSYTDINLFLYYLKLSGLQQTVSRSHAEFLYAVHDNFHQDYLAVNPKKYQLVATFQASGIVVTKYRNLQ